MTDCCCIVGSSMEICADELQSRVLEAYVTEDENIQPPNPRPTTGKSEPVELAEGKGVRSIVYQDVIQTPATNTNPFGAKPNQPEPAPPSDSKP